MQELRFVAVSEDGSYAVLAVPGRSGRYVLPIDERLRAIANGQTSRLAQYEIEVESPLRPKEIQARIRAGETAEEIADAAGIPVERVRWFEGPVLAERAYIADQAQAASVRRAGDSGPGPRLGDIVPARLTASGADPDDAQWDARKRGDGNWEVTLSFPSAGRVHIAEWVFDPRRRHVMPDDDNAARLSLPESELPPEPVAMPGEATVTALAPRLGAAAGMGGGGIGGFASGGPGVGVRSFRPERSVIPDRSLGTDRTLAAERSPALPRPSHSGQASQSSSGQSSSGQSASGPSGQDHAVHHDHGGFRDVTPESAPYFAPDPARHRSAEPATYRASESAPSRAAEPAAHRAPVEPAAHRAPAEPTPYRAPEPAPYRASESAPGHEPEPVAYRDPVPEAMPERPVYRDPVRESPAESSADRAPVYERPAMPQPIMSRDPEPTVILGAREPAALDEQLELAPPAASIPAPATPAAPAAPAAVTVTVPAPARPQAREPERTAPSVPAEPSTPATSKSAPGTPATPKPTPATVAAQQPVPRQPAPVPQAGSAVATAPESPSVAAPEAPAVAAESEAPAKSEAASPAPALTPEPSKPEGDATDDQSGRPRSTSKRNAKGRRSSVPSWDEIMLGSSRQRD